ncbi:hypothetical protein [Pedobacter punctiformis]|uniref:Uncharacterized protein n=1 Tax=Pedobacter punctiformis TaxID=3004097 RepID=A0ABT4L473_9SPHI|nr:hypothetical protein [Pedobacter sp. HCMS5-2]MCZ4242723.1 hypothetical protein [Pedobacter sp. HCMS5-2]
MKRIFTTILIFCCILNVTAQTPFERPGSPNGGITTKGGKNPGGSMLLSVGGGITSPGTATKNNANLSNLTQFSIGAYVPVLSYGGASGGVINKTFGINAGAEYFSGNKDYNITNYSPYNITGQTNNPTVVAKGTGSPKAAGFKTEAGIQANFSFGQITVSPILNAAYINIKQKAFSVTQSSSVNGKTYDYNLYSQTETKTNGFAFIPKLRLSYFPGRLGLFVEGNYTIGPAITNAATTFKPQGTSNTQGFYNIDQMLTGTNTTATKITKYNAIGINGGLMLAIGGEKNTARLKGKVIRMGDKSAVRGKRYFTDTQKIIDEQDKTKDAIEELKLPENIQKAIDEQDRNAVKTFEHLNKPQQKTQSTCNFNVQNVDIKCNGKDLQGNKKYSITIYYKNSSAIGVSSLGHYSNPNIETTSNGNYVEILPGGTATISNLSPAVTAKNFIASGATQTITFDFVPQSGFTSLNIKGHTINAGASGNCDDPILLNLPNCCEPCDLNPITANSVSISQLNASAGTINVVNSISSPNNITRIDADLVSVKYIPANNDCIKCNNLSINQNNFVGTNKIISSGWDNNGNPSTYGGGNSNPIITRSLTFNSANSSGVNLSTAISISHTLGVPPNSCCGDTVELWIRYTVWDKDCHVCEKLVRSTISRTGACGSINGGGTASPSTAAETSQIPTKL